MGTKFRTSRWRLALAILAVVGCASTSAADATKVSRCGAYPFVFSERASPLPHIALSAADRHGDFLLDYGTTESSLSADRALTRSAGAEQSLNATFNLPTFSSGRFLLRVPITKASTHAPQAGVVGTDFLSKLTADFVFGPSGGDVVFGDRPCDADALRAAGMVAVQQAGYFSHDMSRVRNTLPNVPVLFLKLGPVTAFAQIDSGYDDGVFPPSIDINDVLFDDLMRRGVDLEPAGSVVVTTCAGDETRQAFRLRNHSVDVTTELGQVIRSLAGVTLIKKQLGRCGGISSMRDPAAQIGIAALRQIGRIVVDPMAEAVWVQANE